MRRMLKRLVGVRRGQTTVEYGIIVALIAIASISIIMIFGDQLRQLFAGETEQLSGNESATVESETDRIDDQVTGGSLNEF